MNKKVYEDFLRYVAFTDEQVEQNIEDWIAACEKLSISEDDVLYAMNEYIPENWDVKFLGVRKIIGAIIHETIDLCKATRYKQEGKKILYGILPAILTSYQAIKSCGGDDVYVAFPDIFLAKVLNSFFHRLEPMLTCAEASGMSYGCRHCALNKTRITACEQGLIPAPDIIWTWGLNCDEGPKTDEYINCLIDESWNVEITRIPHDTYWGDDDFEDIERINYLADQLNYSLGKVEDALGFKVTPEAIHSAHAAAMGYAMKIAQLNQIAMKADPFPIGGNTLSILGSPMSMPYNTGLGYMTDAVDTLLAEVKQAVKQGEGVVPKGAPKVGVYFTPYCVPWVEKIFRDNGVTLAFSLISVVTPKSLARPAKFKNDPYRSVAEGWLRGAAGGNMGAEFDSWVDKVNTFEPDAMLMGFFDFDRWLGAHHKMGAKYMEEKTGTPVFYIEADFWDDRDYSREALKTRIESICQIAKIHKAKKDRQKAAAK